MGTTHGDAEDADAGALDEKQLPSASYQAEARSAQNDCAQASNRSGYTGSGFMDFGGNGTWIEWNNITAPAAGRYQLQFRFANGGANARGAAVLVNGQSAGTLRFAITGTWTQWSTDTAAVSLREGKNTVRVLANTSSGGPNLDRLDVVATDLCPSDSAKTEPGACGCGVPEGSCSGTATCALADEGRSVTLSCAGGQILKSITFASYGTPTGSCQTGLQASTCNATSSRQAVEAACLGKATCTVLASNAVFSDPCSGTAKRLGVTYQCGTSTTQPPQPPPTSGLNVLDRPTNTKLRIASWNTFRGSVFPKTDSVWRAINTAGTYDPSRTAAAARVFNAVRPDIWLLQETIYSSSGLPSGISISQINEKIRSYMAQITGDNSWQVQCNGRGLCVMIRGAITLRSTCMKNSRANGYLVELRNYSNASLLLANAHYMDGSQAEYTKSMITGSRASASFVAGDFNDGPGGSRYNTVASIPGIQNIAMYQVIDPGATHLASNLRASPENAQGMPVNTKGYVKYGPGSGNDDGLVVSVGGGQIDHFFLGPTSSSWVVRNRITLNTLLLSKETLRRYGLTPLDVALLPGDFAPYFSNFMANGTLREIPSSLFTVINGTLVGMDHDHLPMVVDLDLPNQAPSAAPSLSCP